MLKKLLLTFLILPTFCFGIREFTSVDEYLTFHGFEVPLPEQTDYFAALIDDHPNIKRIGEVRFHGGHLSELFLDCRKEIKVFSFDNMQHEHVKYGKGYISTTYPKRHTLIEGNTATSILTYAKKRPGLTFDLIIVDDSTDYVTLKSEIIDLMQFAHEDTILILKNVKNPEMRKAIKDCMRSKIMEQTGTFKHNKETLGIYRYAEKTH